jgi:acetyltransferase-like isoleucine patch superfamily enzyme
MKRWIKKLLIKWIGMARRILYSDQNAVNNPNNISFEMNAGIGYPFIIGNGKLIKLGKNSYVGRQAWLEIYGEKGEIVIEEEVRIGNFACITAIDSVKIGRGTLISEYFYASDHTHGFDPESKLVPAQQPINSKGGVEIGENCFIGYRVSILPGVKLGKRCVVGAHSVVTRSFPDCTMIAGVPAKAIKKYSFEKKSWENCN